jgi:hypothetical protein
MFLKLPLDIVVIVLSISSGFVLIFNFFVLIRVANFPYRTDYSYTHTNFLKTFDKIPYDELVKFAYQHNRKPLTTNQYSKLLNVHTLLKNKNYHLKEDDYNAIGKAASVLFEHLEIEFMISPNDPLKLENINEILIARTIEKVKNEQHLRNHDKDFNNDIDQDLLYLQNPAIKKKLH